MSEANPDFYAPWPDHRAASDIKVDKYELFLVWPVFVQCLRGDDDRPVKPGLDPGDPQAGSSFLDNWCKTICQSGTWHNRPSAYPPKRGSDAAPAYSEFVYFHPFVRQFLYTTRDDIRSFKNSSGGRGRGATDPSLLAEAVNRNLRILQREDYKKLRARLERKNSNGDFQECELTLDIKTIWLYLFDTQVAMLELRLEYSGDNAVWVNKDETKSPFGPIHLDFALKLNDVIRRVFAAYWSIEPWGHLAGHCPIEMELIADDNTKNVISHFGTFKGTKLDSFREAAFPEASSIDQAKAVEAQLDHVYYNREQGCSRLWQKLMEPLAPVALEGNKGFPLRFEQILDERVPIFAYLAVEDPHQITPGDWVRLATVDDDGDSQTYPYSPSFLTPDHLKDFFYDRFWNDYGCRPAQQSVHCTRWLFSGYGFLGVGPSKPGGFFTNDHSGALAHFRHHYFALGLIAHFHRASLLRFKHALAEAAEKLHDAASSIAGMQTFCERVNALQRDFLRFRTRYWFVEISNQLQGREVFDLWKKHLNTPALFADIAGDIAAAEESVHRFVEERRNDLLFRIALIGAIFAIVTPTLSIYQEDLKGAPRLGAAGILITLIGILGLVFNINVAVIPGSIARLSKRIVAILARVPGWLYCLLITFIGLWILLAVPLKYPAPSPTPAPVSAPGPALPRP
jgi:hypothetical protein